MTFTVASAILFFVLKKTAPHAKFLGDFANFMQHRKCITVRGKGWGGGGQNLNKNKNFICDL